MNVMYGTEDVEEGVLWNYALCGLSSAEAFDVYGCHEGL